MSKHKENILNLPNFITTIRAGLIPLMVWLVFTSHLRIIIAVIIMIGLSDIIDGWLARTLRQKTRFGQVYDSVVDYLLLFVSLIVVMVIKLISVNYHDPSVVAS
jgi:cardiolipin synthase